MDANSFTLEAARRHEAELLKLAAPKVVPPRRPARRRTPVWILRRLARQPALLFDEAEVKDAIARIG